MKKIILIFTVVCTLMFTMTSCKKDTKIEVKKEMATTIYQCPMNCEQGKSYTKAGNCPVCKMALKEKKAGETIKTQTKETIKKHKQNDHGHGHEH